MNSNEIDYEELARQAENGEYETDIDAQEFTGAEAKRALVDFFHGYSGNKTINVEFKPGRPIISDQTGESPMLRVRISKEMDMALKLLCEEKNTSKSDLVRELLVDGIQRELSAA